MNTVTTITITATINTAIPTAINPSKLRAMFREEMNSYRMYKLRGDRDQAIQCFGRAEAIRDIWEACI